MKREIIKSCYQYSGRRNDLYFDSGLKTNITYPSLDDPIPTFTTFKKKDFISVSLRYRKRLDDVYRMVDIHRSLGSINHTLPTHDFS